jgi:hypothetical protein
MTRLNWGALEFKTYETGIDRGVFYPQNRGVGVAWNGLTQVDEIYSDSEEESQYIDGRKYSIVTTKPEFKVKVYAYTEPHELYLYTGHAEIAPGLFADNQPKKLFDFSYRTLVGSADPHVKQQYKIHFVYNAYAIPEDVTHDTIQSGQVLRSWRITTVPVNHKTYTYFTSLNRTDLEPRGIIAPPTSTLVVYSGGIRPKALDLLEKVIYGTETTNPVMPRPEELYELIR